MLDPRPDVPTRRLSRIPLLALGLVALSWLACAERDGETSGLIAPGHLDHLAIRVSDLDRSLDFYSKLFGADIARYHEPIIANLDSVPTPHAWLYMEWSYLALSLASEENGPPGIDHFCMAVPESSDEAVARGLETRQLNRRIDPKWFPEVLWAEDPSGHILQFTTKMEGFVGRGNSGESSPEKKVAGAFSATGVTWLTLGISRPEATLAYYRRLLGPPLELPEHATGRRGVFSMGRSSLELVEPAIGESFRVGVRGFDPAAAIRVLSDLGVPATATADGGLHLVDPDGIHLQIGPHDEEQD